MTFAFLFLFVCSPEEGKESVLLFLSSSRKGERECVLSFCFMIKGKEKRTFSVLFSSSASDKKHSFRSFFFFLKKESVLSLASVWGGEGRIIVVFFFFSFFFCLYEKGKRFLHMDAGVLFFFLFRLQDKKRRHNDFRQWRKEGYPSLICSSSRRKDHKRMIISFPVFFLSCFRKKRGKDFPLFFP